MSKREQRILGLEGKDKITEKRNKWSEVLKTPRRYRIIGSKDSQQCQMLHRKQDYENNIWFVKWSLETLGSWKIKGIGDQVRFQRRKWK